MLCFNYKQHLTPAFLVLCSKCRWMVWMSNLASTESPGCMVLVCGVAGAGWEEKLHVASWPFWSWGCTDMQRITSCCKSGGINFINLPFGPVPVNRCLLYSFLLPSFVRAISPPPIHQPRWVYAKGQLQRC